MNRVQIDQFQTRRVEKRPMEKLVLIFVQIPKIVFVRLAPVQRRSSSISTFSDEVYRKAKEKRRFYH